MINSIKVRNIILTAQAAEERYQTDMKLSDIHIRDPFILPNDNVYYLYGTREGARGFDVYKSPDLENWSGPKDIFTPPVDFWADRDYWAPEVHKYKGRYYMTASFKNAVRRRGTQILVCDKPDGNFTPHSDGPVTPEDMECLDGTLYIDSKGVPYMVFCHEWLQISDGRICAIRLSNDLTHAVGKPVTLFSASESPAAIKGASQYVSDGPFMYRTKSGKLLMLWSTFSENGYVEGIASSDSGELDGVWSQSDKLLFANDGGHGMVFNTFEGDLIFVMHSPNVSPLERPVLFPVRDTGDLLERV